MNIRTGTRDVTSTFVLILFKEQKHKKFLENPFRLMLHQYQRFTERLFTLTLDPFHPPYTNPFRISPIVYVGSSVSINLRLGAKGQIKNKIK